MSQVLFPHSFSLNLPIKPNPEISRDNLIKVIKDQFDNGVSIIFITGDEEIGKSNLLLQFAVNCSATSFACFLKPLNKFSSLIENIILDIINQIQFYIYKRELQSDIIYDYQSLSDYLNKLIKSSKNRDQFYILLDGFENIEDKDVAAFFDFFQILPFGFSRFKFLFSDRDQLVQNRFLKEIIYKGKLKYKEHSVLPFSLAEIKSFFTELKLNTEQNVEVLKITGGIAGRVRSVFDKLNDGVTFDLLFSEISNFSDFIEREISAIDFSNEQLSKILSLIALEDLDYSIELISEIFHLDMEEVGRIIASSKFLTISENSIQFKSSYFKKYLRQKLYPYQNFIEEVIINYHISNEDKIDSILELPKRYEKIKKYEELLNVLNEEHFFSIIERKESYNFLEEQTVLGIRAAEKLDKVTDYYRLSLQKATIAQMKQTFVWESEIEAKIELKDFDTARKLAEETLLKEERFRHLVFIAKMKKEKKLMIEPDLIEAIKSLYNQINPQTFYDPQEILNIASNLVYTLPKLAVEFIDKANGNSDSEHRDYNFAQLTLLMQKVEKNDDEHDSDVDILSKIKDSKIRNFTNLLPFHNDSGSVEQFIEQLKTVETSSDQIFLARKYIAENPKINNIKLLIEFAINLFINHSSNNPITSNALYDISTPIPFFKNDASDIIIKLDSFKQISKERGPTVTHYKYMINLGCGELIFNFELARLRFVEIYNEVSKILDVGIRTECFSYLFKSIILSDKENRLQESDQLKDNLIIDIENGIEKLLISSAKHDRILKNILCELITVNPDKVIFYCNKLNTRSARDSIYLDTAQAYLANEFDLIQLSYLKKLYHFIIDPQLKNSFCIKILERYKDATVDVLSDYGDLLFYVIKIKDFYSVTKKIQAYIVLLKIVHKSPSKAKLLTEFIEEIRNFWNGLDNLYDKISFGFKLATILLPINRELSIEFHDLAEKEKKRLFFSSPIAINVFYNAIRLHINSLTGIINSGIIEYEMIEKVMGYIKLIPDKTGQLKIIADILIVLYKAENTQLFNKLYSVYLKGEVDLLINKGDLFSKAEFIYFVEMLSPVLYVHNQETLYLLIEKVHHCYKDDCLDEVFKFLKFKKNKASQIQEKDDLKVDFHTAISMVGIIERFKTDIYISEAINDLRICAKNNSFTKEELIILKDRIGKIIEQQLPDTNNIKHDGYKVLCSIYLLKIGKNKIEGDWQKILGEIRKIPNKSDRSYVLTQMAYLLPSLSTLSKTSILNEAISEIENNESYVARVQRYSDIKKIMKEINVNECKERLKRAISDSISQNTFQLYSEQKSIIDFAYDIEPSFADELVKIVDDDPARQPLTNRLKDHLKRLKTNQDFIKDKLEFEIKGVRNYANACSAYVQKLRIGRVRTKHLKEASEWLRFAHMRPFSETFSIFMLFSENANIRFENGIEHARTQLLPLCHATLRNLQMVKVLAGKVKIGDSSLKQSFSKLIDERVIINIGERSKGINYILSWVEKEVVEYLKICDPYFSHLEVDFLKEIFLIKPNIKISILAQPRNPDIDVINAYRKGWEAICDQDPPDIRIVMASLKNSSNHLYTPSHDRWLTTYQSGLRLGTSINGIGKSISEISVMDNLKAAEIEETIINSFINKDVRTVGKDIVNYFEFNL